MEYQIQISESYVNKYERRAHSVGVSMWHFEWCTKYRYKMMQKEEYRNLANGCIRKSAREHGIKVMELNVQPEHVHCVVAIPLRMSPAYAMQILKGRSSKLIFEHHEKSRLRYPKGHFWSKGKFAASIGFVQVETAKHYVRNQDVRHSTYGSHTL